MFRKVFLFILLTCILSAKTFLVSYDPDYAPFSYALNHKPYGLFIDIWRLWADKNNYNIKFIEAQNWDDALTLAQEKKVDFFLGTTPHAPWMYGSQSFYKTKTTLYFLKSFNKKMQSIGIIGDDYEQTLHKKLPHCRIVSFQNYNQLLHALLEKKVDTIYDDTLAIAYYAIKNGYKHLIKNSELLVETSDVDAISATQQNVDLFTKGFCKISLHELEKIEKEWISEKEMRFYNNANFLKKKELTYVYDPDWKPFEYKDKMSHKHMGIIADILSLISSKSGLIFHPVATNTWAESVALLKAHKVDMVSAVPVTPERKKYLHFTKKNIYNYPAVLVTNKDKTFAINENFTNKTIGIVKGNSLGQWIEKKYPQAHFILFNNLHDGFEALQNNRINFFGINGVSATYYINVLSFSKCKIYTILDYVFSLKIALLKDVNPEVLALIDEALSQISQKELSDIYHKWTSVQIKREVNYKLIFIIIAVSLLIVIIFLFINKRLNRLVQKRTRQLKELNEHLEEKVQQRTKELALINKKMQDNIKYASLIQNAILPHQKEFTSFFKDAAIIWEPKDTVGGDIYFFTQLNEEEAFLFVIDCTGHGVSGAFVTMLLKAIEKQLLTLLKHKILSPAEILTYFNNTFKKVLIQENSDANVGFDAGILYINKTTKELRFAGANIALYYLQEQQLHTLKANRHSIGYNTSKKDYTFQEHHLSFQEGMQFYITTDGFIDQNGGEKGFPFGKKRFFELLCTNAKHPLHTQKILFLEALAQYQGDEDRNDDITLIALQII